MRERWSESGVPDKVVDDAIAHGRKTGGVLSEAALHPCVLHMLRDLHDGTWLRLDGGYLIETSLGSRQGCKFGAIIFNLTYCRALDDLRCDLRNEGLLSVLNTTQRLRHGVTWRAKGMALNLRSHPTRCVTSPKLMMNVCALTRTRMMSFWRNSRGLLTSCRKCSPVISWNSIGNRSKLNVYYTWLAVGQSVPGRQ